MNDLEAYELRRANPERLVPTTSATCGRAACARPFERAAKGPGSNAKYCSPTCVRAVEAEARRAKRARTEAAAPPAVPGPRKITCQDCPAVFTIDRPGSAPVRCEPCRARRRSYPSAKGENLTPEQLARIEAQQARIEAGCREEDRLSARERGRREQAALARLERAS